MSQYSCENGKSKPKNSRGCSRRRTFGGRGFRRAWGGSGRVGGRGGRRGCVTWFFLDRVIVVTLK